VISERLSGALKSGEDASGQILGITAHPLIQWHHEETATEA